MLYMIIPHRFIISSESLSLFSRTCSFATYYHVYSVPSWNSGHNCHNCSENDLHRTQTSHEVVATALALGADAFAA